MTGPSWLRARHFTLDGPGRARRPTSPATALIAGFAVLIAIGTVILMLPISSAGGTWTSPVDAAFTATSAACVTGLVVVDTATHWSPFGQIAILLLMQIGGFGFMTGSTFLLLLAAGRRSRLTDRLLAQATVAAPDLGSVRTLVRRVALFTVVAEGAGALLLGLGFVVSGLSLPTAVGEVDVDEVIGCRVVATATGGIRTCTRARRRVARLRAVQRWRAAAWSRLGVASGGLRAQEQQEADAMHDADQRRR